MKAGDKKLAAGSGPWPKFMYNKKHLSFFFFFFLFFLRRLFLNNNKFN